MTGLKVCNSLIFELRDTHTGMIRLSGIFIRLLNYPLNNSETIGRGEFREN